MFGEEIIYFRNTVATSVKNKEDHMIIILMRELRHHNDFPQLVSIESQNRIQF